MIEITNSVIGTIDEIRGSLESIGIGCRQVTLDKQGLAITPDFNSASTKITYKGEIKRILRDFYISLFRLICPVLVHFTKIGIIEDFKFFFKENTLYLAILESNGEAFEDNMIDAFRQFLDSVHSPGVFILPDIDIFTP